MTDESNYTDVRVGLDGNLGATLRVAPDDSASGVAVVEHTLPPETLAAPLHRHAHEDEISYVLQGTMGVEEDGAVSTVEAGEFAVKERGRWHTFWNPGSEPLRFLEFVAPGSFAWYFGEVSEVLPVDGSDEESLERLATIQATYDLELRPESVPDLRERHGLDG